MKYLSLSIAAILIIFLSSCTGPEGPAGPSGNANVKTILFSTNLNSWVLYDSDGLGIYEKKHLLFNQNIYDFGSVLVYYKDSESSYWREWNQTVIFNGKGFMLSHAVDNGSIALIVQSTTGNGIPILLDQILNFKIVIIQGILVSSQINKNSDYDKIKYLYNLSD